MRVAIIYDRVNKYGGAERFIQSLLKIFPKAPIYTLVSNSRANWQGNHQVYPTFLNHFFFLRNRHELLSAVAPLAFETHDLSNYDLLISVTSSDAKAIITSPNQVHLCFCLTPTRYLWSGYSDYKKDLKLKLLPKVLLKYFRLVDYITSTRPDYFIAISKEVKKRIFKYYHRNSTVIYPPVDDIFFKKITYKERDNYLIVSRLVPYKKVDMVIKLFNKTNRKLIIVGTGNQLNKLKKLARGNITFLGEVSNSELIKNYQQAKAVIFPQWEDFGLVPLESQACGTPVIAYKKGGALETVIDGKTGILFKNQTIKSLENALVRFESSFFNKQDCVKNASLFRYSSFRKKIQGFIKQLPLQITRV